MGIREDDDVHWRWDPPDPAGGADDATTDDAARHD